MVFAAEREGIVTGAGGDGLALIGVEPEVLDLVPELGGVAGVDDDGKAGGKDIVDAQATGDDNAFLESHGEQIDPNAGLDFGIGANGQDDEAGAGGEIDKEAAIGVVVEQFDVGGDGESGERRAMGEDVRLVGGENFDGVAERGHGGEEGGKIAAGASPDEDKALIGGGGLLDKFPGVYFEGNVAEACQRKAIEGGEGGEIAEIDQQEMDPAERPAEPGK